VSANGVPKAVDFLWLLVPLAVLAAFRKGAEPAGLAAGFALYFVGPLLGGLTMLEKGRSVRAGLLVVAFSPSPARSHSSASQATSAGTCPHRSGPGEEVSQASRPGLGTGAGS
jgi:hypothetical protein